MATPRQPDSAAYDELGELYDAWTANVVDDVPFYLGLAAALAAERASTALRILELGAGTGRISVPLAEQGHRVTALDASHGQLQRLRARLTRSSVSADIVTVTADMRDAAARLRTERFDLVIAPFRGLLHVAEDRDALLTDVHGLLDADGGVFAFDVFHPRLSTVAASMGDWMHRTDAPTAHGRWRFDERARYRKAGTVLELDVRARWSRRPVRRPWRHRNAPAFDGDLHEPSDGESRERRTHMRLATPPASAWHASITEAGFTVDGVYGWFDGAPFDANVDDDSIWVVRRVR